MTGRAVHVSDLHRGANESRAVDDALVALVAALSPDVVVATGDLATRGRRGELEGARALLDRLGSPWVAVPGNHDIPYTVPARLVRPWAVFEDVLGPTDPFYRSDSIVVCGLNSVRPWRHQGGALSRAHLDRLPAAFADGPPGALRAVAFHHHVAGAPWRASRKLPLKHRARALTAFRRAGVELVLGGHIHQASAAERREFTVTAGGEQGSLVLVTAPGLGRPRPRRTGEALGLQVIEWTHDEVAVETRVWGDDAGAFRPSGRRVFPR